MFEIAEKPRGESFGIIDRQAGDAVERALRLPQEHAGNRCQAFEEHIAAALILGDDGASVFIAQLVGADGDELRESRRRESSLRQP